MGQWGFLSIGDSNLKIILTLELRFKKKAEHAEMLDDKCVK